jgi:hypothetical protein
MTGLARLHLLLEGQTEETITRDIIGPHLESVGWFVAWSIIKTKRPAVGPAHRGGVGSWAHIERDVRLLLRDSSLTVVTTDDPRLLRVSQGRAGDGRPSVRSGHGQGRAR